MEPDHADPRTQQGLAMIALLAIVLVVAVIGIAMVGFMNSDMTLAGIQGDVSRAHYAADAGVQAAIQRLSSDPSFASEPCPPSGSSWPGTGRIDVGPRAGTFSYCAAPWGPDPTAAIYLVVSEGQYGRYSRRVGALASYGAGMSGVFGRNGVLFDGSSAINRTYLAPLTMIGDTCVERTPGPGTNIGSLRRVHFQDPGVRINAIGTGGPFTLQGLSRQIPDYELFGFCTMPAFDPNSPTIPPTLMGRFGAIVQGAPVGSSPPAFATLTVRNDDPAVVNRCPGSLFTCSISVLRGRVSDGGANMTDVYFSQIEKQIMPLPSIDRETLRAEARSNVANSFINEALGFPATHRHSAYSQREFECILWYIARHPGTVLRGPVFVTGTVEIRSNLPVGNGQCREGGTSSRPSDSMPNELTIRPVSGSTPAFLAVENVARENRALFLGNNATLRIGDIPFDAPSFAGQLARGGVFTFSSTDSNGRIELGTSSVFRVIGLSYTENGTVVGQTVMYDLVGLTHNGARDMTSCRGSGPQRLCSFDSQNATVVVRYDSRAANRFGGRNGSLGILSWWQEQ